MKQTNLELSIERLLLPDLSYRQRMEVAVALEQELTRLWRAKGAPSGFVGESLALGVTKIEVAAGASPAGIGIQVAQALYSEIAGVNPSSGTAGRSNS